jgi:hypothetical protein
LWTGALSSQNEKCTGQIESITFTDTRDRTEPLAYSLYCTSSYGENSHFPFRISTNNPNVNTMKAVGQKMKNHCKEAVAFWPMQNLVPRLYYVGIDDDPFDPHWELTLPPFSSMYTSYEHFFLTLGFNGGLLSDAEGDQAAIQDVEIKVIGGRPTARVRTNVYGFFNRTDLPFMWRGVSIYPGITLNEILSEDTQDEEDWPTWVQLQMEQEDRPQKKVTLPNPRPVVKEEAIAALSYLLEAARRELGLTSIQVEVARDGPGNSITLATRPIVGSKLTVILGFDSATSDVFGVTRLLMLYFNIAYHRTYTFELRTGGKVNPFLGKTQILVLGYGGRGPARSWVEGRGFSTVRGIIDEKKVAWVADTEFDTNNQRLALEFNDLERIPHSFVYPVKAHLLMSFTKSLAVDL